jgi:Escherichia/Staphylococcus phage prohead protease
MSNQNNNKQQEQEEQLARLVRRELALLRLDRWERALAALGGAGAWKALETKALAPSEWKRVDVASGLVTGYGSVYTVDLGKDEIEPGAYAKTLAEARAFARSHQSPTLFPVLWMHDRHEPIGYVSEAYEDKKGLRCTFVIDPTIERGRQALAGLKHGTLSFSIGYKPLDYFWKGGVRVLKEIALAEISVVTFPMQPEARVATDDTGNIGNTDIGGNSGRSAA